MKKNLKANIIMVLCFTFIFFSLSGSGLADVLDDVKSRGIVNCGVPPGFPGFSSVNNEGVRVGFDIDHCRAIAAGVLGDPTKIKLTPVGLRDGFPSLRAGSLDVLTHRFTWTLGRDAGGVDWARAMTYDGQGFIVRKDSGVKKLADLDGATICTSQGSTMEINTTDYFRKNNLKFELLTFKTVPEAFSAYVAKRCDCMTAGGLGLVANSQKLADPENHVILPERISMEPIGPLVASGQSRWCDAVRWVLNALIAAEELGVTQSNVDEQRKSSKNPEVRRLLGVTGDLGKKLGLSNDWAYNVIKAVGNYGEIFDRHVGPNTRLKLDRGLNELWSKGGLLVSPPIR